jgi:hypothetical protein
MPASSSTSSARRAGTCAQEHDACTCSWHPTCSMQPSCQPASSILVDRITGGSAAQQHKHEMQQRIAAGPYSYMCTVYSTVSASLIGRKQPPQTAIAGAGSSSRRRRQQQAAAVRRHMQGRCVRAGGGGAGGRSASRKWCSGHHGAGSERHSAKAKTRTCSRPSPHASKVRSTGLLTLLCSHHALCASSSSTIIVALA